MKVFVTLATILGVAHSSPNAQIHPLSQIGSVGSSLPHSNNMPKIGMSVQNYQAQSSPDQYHLQDKFGNFEYAYANQDSEKMEKGNNMSVRGRYAYVMSDGVLRRVEYIADNSGFHILQDNADKSRAQDRTKRSVQPDLLQTRMTSVLDSSLRDNAMVSSNMYKAMMGSDAPNKMMLGNSMSGMSSDRDIYGMMGVSSNMMVNNMMGDAVMDRSQEMSSNIMGQRGMATNMMGRNMYSNMMGLDQASNMMNGHVVGQEMSSNMMDRHDMSTNMMNINKMASNMYSDMMGVDMTSNIMGQDKLSNMMSQRMNTHSSNINGLPLGQRNTMSQRMQIEQIPQLTDASNQFF